MDKGSDEVKGYDVKEKLPQSFWNFSDKNAAEIQREIRTTRAELDETVHAIQERLAPQQFVNQISDMVRDTIRQGSPRIMEAVRNNPLPSSLVVLGLGWLFIRGTAGPQRRFSRGYGRYGELEEDYGLVSGEQVSSIEATDLSGGVASTYEQGKEKTAQATRRIKSKAGQWTEQAKDKASQLSEQAKETASQWTDQAKETASQWTEQVKGKASQWTGQAKDTVSQLASQTRERAGQMASGVMHKAGDVASQMAEATREKASQLAGATVETAGHLMSATASKAGDLAHSTAEMTGNVVHLAGEQARHLGTATQRQLKRAGTGTAHLYQENPGAFALLCLGVGAALAMGLPTTRKEQELMGEQSESLKQQLKETGQQTLGKVEEIVSAGQEAMKEEARKQDVI